jgi:hypothetical protein
VIRTAYKIVEWDGKSAKTLFHTSTRGREIPRGKWVRALSRSGRDGTSKTWYTTGWHSLPTLADAKAYGKKFVKRLDRLRIVKCRIKNTWPKTHSPSPVLLSLWLKFDRVVAKVSGGVK